MSLQGAETWVWRLRAHGAGVREDAENMWVWEEGPKQEEAEQASDRGNSLCWEGGRNLWERQLEWECSGRPACHREVSLSVSLSSPLLPLGKERSQSGLGRRRDNAENPGLELEQVRLWGSSWAGASRVRNQNLGKAVTGGSLRCLRVFGSESVFTQTHLLDSRIRGSLTFFHCEKWLYTKRKFPFLFLVKCCNVLHSLFGLPLLVKLVIKEQDRLCKLHLSWVFCAKNSFDVFHLTHFFTLDLK